MLGSLNNLITNVLALQGSGFLQRPISDPSSSNPTAVALIGTFVGTTTVLSPATATVNKYLGIPFAEKPDRFSKPLPTSTSEKPYLAQSWKPACIQQFSPSPLGLFYKSVFGGEDVTESEDCLYLNIYSPDTPNPKKPVMFWIFGGGLRYGHAGQSLYDGSSLASSQDVVVVTINYRTNVFGFPSSPAIPRDGKNLGYYDQRQALDWTIRNIHAFGGDPRQITLFGQSAGSKSVDRLVLSSWIPPRPFRAAILQSDVATYNTKADVSVARDSTETTSWEELTTKLNCNVSDADTNKHHNDTIKHDKELACVKNQDWRNIRNIINGPRTDEKKSWDWFPAVDEVTNFNWTNRHTQRVPILLGSNGQESRVFDVDQLDWPNKAQSNTLQKFQCPAAQTAQHSQSQGNKTWRYLFNARFPSTNPSAALKALGDRSSRPEIAEYDLAAFHTSEIAYVFGNLPEGSTDVQYSLSQNMQTAWANFAKDPSQGPGVGWDDYSGSKVAVWGSDNSDTYDMVSASDLDVCTSGGESV